MRIDPELGLLGMWLAPLMRWVEGPGKWWLLALVIALHFALYVWPGIPQ